MVSTDNEYDDQTYDRAVQTFEDFYCECFQFMAQFGEIEDLLLVDNISEHVGGGGIKGVFWIHQSLFDFVPAFSKKV